RRTLQRQRVVLRRPTCHRAPTRRLPSRRGTASRRPCRARVRSDERAIGVFARGSCRLEDLLDGERKAAPVGAFTGELFEAGGGGGVCGPGPAGPRRRFPTRRE